ncbi:MAG: hypothetical protein ACC726_14635, partial [Chloroflexota bacterium]
CMTGSRVLVSGMLAIAMLVGVLLITTSVTPRVVLAQGVGRASWTPSTTETKQIPSKLLVAGDSIIYATEAVWSRSQVEGLQVYVDRGLRYTHEVNDRSGRLSATGYWATNYPDPAFDRDDDDGDGRWEEAEITAGVQPPRAGVPYTSLVQFSRWHGKRQKGVCGWAWDRRMGSTEVLSQLSRDLLGEWQAERYTQSYEALAYPRVALKPKIPVGGPAASCRVRRAQPSQSGIVVTFAEPMGWSAFVDLQEALQGRWTAFEAIGSSATDQLTWTCGGPVTSALGLQPCRAMGVKPEGVSAAVGFFDGGGIDALRKRADVARVDALRDPVTDLLFGVGGFGVELPGLGVNDAYWELFLAD